MRYLFIFCLLSSPIWAQIELEHSVFNPGDYNRLVSSERFHFTSERIYVAGRYILHAFDYQGVCQEEFDPGESWRFANFTVTAGQDQIIASMTKRVGSGEELSLDYQMVLFDTELAAGKRAKANARGHLGESGEVRARKRIFDPRLAQPEKAYFRNLFALPDGDILANVWQGYGSSEKPSSTKGMRMVSLQKIRLLDRLISDNQSDGLLVDFVDKPLYTRFFEAKSALTAYKRIIMAQSSSGGKLFFVHPMETVVGVVHRTKFGRLERDHNLNLRLPNFRSVENDVKNIRREDVSLIEGFLCLPDDKFLVIYRPGFKSDIIMRLQDAAGESQVEMDISSSWIYAGANNNVTYFIDSESNFTTLEEVHIN
jgi:hypothetical protein